MKKYILSIVLILFAVTFYSCMKPAEPLLVGFWNVENLFDLDDDPDTNDDEFAAGGRKHMTVEILKQKLDHLAEVLADLDADLVGLAEIENRAVLEMLNRHYPGRDYSIIHYESPDERGIDVALLYDASCFKVIHSEPIKVELDNPTRDILYVVGKYAGRKLHVFVNHWPSHYGGTEQTIPLRIKTAKTLRARVDEILTKNPAAEIIIVGDLNDAPTDPSVHAYLGSVLERPGLLQEHQKKEPCSEEQRAKCGGCPGQHDEELDQRVMLWNLMGPFEGRENGTTYKYRDENKNIDHIIVSPGLADERGLAIVDRSITIIDKPKYRQHTGRYDGYPFRFWAGDRLLGGYSDHMAVRVAIARK